MSPQQQLQYFKYLLICGNFDPTKYRLSNMIPNKDVTIIPVTRPERNKANLVNAE